MTSWDIPRAQFNMAVLQVYVVLQILAPCRIGLNRGSGLLQGRESVFLEP